MLVVLGLMATAGCGGSGLEPSVPECQYSRSGTIVLVNLADTANARDVYVDGRYIGVLRYQSQIAVTAAAGVHTVEWVSVVTGNTVDSIRVVIDECSTTTVSNVY